ncbi:MAG: flagellar hook-basal body complex protein [Deltaproteobacteria bacterium]|jgi:flagellar hook-basal body protein|nr:flagellar hook-basal body complex protein [Deltaproteobacteria bacterium]
MSISAAMYAAVTGLSALSTGMQVISNNIANVNTVGFKAGRTNFEDLISQDYWSNGKIQQIGRGVKVASVQQMFTQGSFMNSAQDTDMAITGEGFFQVRDRVTNELMYTRAGNFTFDANGLLETPAGYVLQGWQLSVPKPGAEPSKLGVPQDIKVIAMNAPPVETSQIKVVANLNADDTSAYPYPQSAWAVMYAKQVASGPAEAAEQAAIDAIYNYDLHGSAYNSNTSQAFLTAYEDFMSSMGFQQVQGGSFEKNETSYPTDPQKASAHSAALALANAALNLSGQPYPLTSNSSTYSSAYNAAYEKAMSGNGFYLSGGTTNVFKRTDPVTPTQTTAANLSALAAAGLPSSYVYGTDEINDAAYLDAYTEKMSSLGYKTVTSGIPGYWLPPTSQESADSIDPAINTDFALYPGSAAAENSAINHYFLDQGYQAFPPFVYDGTTIQNPSFFKQADPVLLDPLRPAAHLAASAAVSLLANAPANYTYPSGEPAFDKEYVSAYNAYIFTQQVGGRSYQAPIPGMPNFFKVTVATPGSDQAVLAEDEANKAADRTLTPATTTYPSNSSIDIFKDAYNAGYIAWMASNGFTDVNSTPPYFSITKPRTPTSGEVAAAQETARAMAEMEAENAGKKAYDIVYQPLYDQAMTTITGKYEPWQLEGMGFAGAWDGTDLTSPIDPENYTHANPWTIYDSLGTAHTLMVYYQPNPNLENVWDYIITSDPTEDARPDANKNLFMEGATFAGLIQKGKITFTADGPDRHGGVIKDIEAQNIDLSATAIAFLTSAAASAISPATASSINYFKFGGNFNAKPVFSATTGTLVSQARTYTLKWAGNLNVNVSGFTWEDSNGKTGTIPVPDKNYTGPYVLDSGLTVSFSGASKPMAFTSGDTVSVVAHSEEIGWKDLTPNELGYFDFDVYFVQSANMSPHPPYEMLETMVQHISLDMGARDTTRTGENWILDEQGTTQYASESINIFSSQDGYPPGSLQRVSIDKDGILTGIYTNGRHQPLYQIGLARFMNPWGLAKLGDNVYMETRWSGVGVLNDPGYNGNGTIRANFLEQSNTDLADEIVNMIVTQRGFQANSKVVTTTDTMLAEVIEMKR